MSLFLQAIQSKNQSGRPPIWLMRQAGRYLPEYRQLREKYDFLELAKNPELIAQVTLQPIERFGMDAAILFSDILMVLKCFGIPFHFEEGKGPIITTPSAFDNLPYSPPKESLSFVSEGVKEIKRRSPVPLIGFAGAPFTVLAYVIEGGSFRHLSATKRLMFHQKEVFATLMNRFTEATIDYLTMQWEAGVQTLQLFDSWAGLLAYADFMEWVLPSYKKIVEAMNKIHAPLILFCKGSFPFVKEASVFPFSGISLDPPVSLKAARSLLPPKLVLQGNFDPEILANAPKEIIRERAKAMLTNMGSDPSYIFNLGHGVLPQTPLESVYTLVETVHQWQDKK